MSEFYKYFKENMEALNLPAPESLFGNLQSTLGSATAILGLIEKMGRKVTIREIVGAGTRLEQLLVIGGVGASYYLGAIIGSIAVATPRSAAGGKSLSDLLFTAHQYNLSRPWFAEEFQRWPSLYNRKLIDQNTYINRRVLA